MIAHIWTLFGGWYLLELAEGDSIGGFRIVGTAHFKDKVAAKQAANLAGAKAWNY